MMRAVVLLICMCLAGALQRKDHPVTDAMEGVGGAAGTTGTVVGGTAGAVGGDIVVDGAGSVANGAGGAVGSGASAVGEPVVGQNPMKEAPVVGSSFSTSGPSTALKCVINLTVQYMLIYTALAIVRTTADVWRINYGSMPLQASLEQASLTVNYAPMLAILFLAVRMRVNWLTQGQGTPQHYVQVWMLYTTFSVLAMSLVALAVPLFTGVPMHVNEETGDIPEDAKPFQNWIAAACFTVLKYLIMIGLYVGVVVIIYGAVNFEPPAGSFHEGAAPPVSPAVACTMIFTGMYFVVYAFIQLGKTFTSFTEIDSSKITGALQGAVSTMAFAPMLSVLFIAARMRALQMDPIHGAPQKWAQNCFYACTYAVATQCALAIAVPLVLGGSVSKGNMGTGDVEYKVNNKCLGGCLTVARWVVMLCVYLGFAAVIWSIFVLEHPKGAEFTPPISATMQCVINLCFQYFFVYLMVWIAITVMEHTGWDWHLLKNTMENAKGTTNFCPMLAILFVGTRMRALQITNQRGAPQGWAQDGMYLATWALLLQFLMVLCIPVATYFMEGKATTAEVDKDGNVKWNPSGRIALFCVQVIRWLGFFLLYGGVIAVVYGAMTLTPETANGRGALPLAGKTPFAKEPYGANDLPGVPN